MEKRTFEKNGKPHVRITSEHGVYDKHSGKNYSEVIVPVEKESLFIDGLSVSQIDDHQYEVIKPSYDSENPVVWVEGMTPVNNAFYLKDGKTYVWMNEWVEW